MQAHFRMFYVHVRRKSDQFILQYNCLAYIIEINFYSEPRIETLKIIQINGSYERIKYAHISSALSHEMYLYVPNDCHNKEARNFKDSHPRYVNQITKYQICIDIQLEHNCAIS